MTDAVDPIHFNDLAACDPQAVCRRAGAQYDGDTGGYRLTLWGQTYRIDPHRCRIDCLTDCHHPIHDYFYLFMVHYLLTAKAIELANEWISEKEIPGGAAFFRGPHEIPTHRIANRFDTDRHQFHNRCRQLGGTPLRMADSAYEFHVAPRIPLAVLCWAGDDEFPAEAKLLYDKTIAQHVALDVIFALAVGVCEQLAQPE